MKAFICVYRHTIPSNKDLETTADKKHPLLRKFLAEYQQSNCFYDWGDDPAFFSAKEILGDYRFTTWGVCRRDVRKQLSEGDLVIYFCGKQRPHNRKNWDYYFIGFGTVAQTIWRAQLWLDEQYVVYRNFLNVLAILKGGKLKQYEYFGNGHEDWKERLKAPYIIFDQEEQLTNFNLDNPLQVATRLENSPLEQWYSDRDELVYRLEKSLFINLGVERRLRTKSEQHARRHIALHKYIADHQQSDFLIKLRNELYTIALDIHKNR